MLVLIVGLYGNMLEIEYLYKSLQSTKEKKRKDIEICLVFFYFFLFFGCWIEQLGDKIFDTKLRIMTINTAKRIFRFSYNE